MKKMFLLSLEAKVGKGRTRFTTGWVLYDGRLKRGSRITLVGHPEKWTVLHVSTVYEVHEINRGWKVGGL
jgi:hypothetical protein